MEHLVKIVSVPNVNGDREKTVHGQCPSSLASLQRGKSLVTGGESPTTDVFWSLFRLSCCIM